MEKKTRDQYVKTPTENEVSFPNRLAPVRKTIFHQCVISYTCSQFNSGGSVFLNRAIRVRLATCI